MTGEKTALPTDRVSTTDTFTDQIREARDHERAGRLRPAEEIYRRVLATKPNHAKALRGLGVIAHRARKNDDAIELLRRAVAADPTDVECHNDLGSVLGSMGRTKEAVDEFRKTVELRPDYAEALGNLGMALSRLGKDEEALTCHRRAADLRPQSAAFRVGLGTALAKANKLDEAVIELRSALSIDAVNAEAHARFGGVLRQLQRFDEAAASLSTAIRLRPNAPEPHVNLGLTYLEQNRPEEAVACMRTALRLKPDYAEAHWNMGLALLLQGDFVNGWPEYEWRRPLRNEHGIRRDATQPLWDGRDLEGRTLLLHTEQGLGDVIQFARYAAVAKTRGAGKVILQVPPPLKRLLASVPGLDVCVARGEELPSFDVHAPVMSLPAVLGMTADQVPAEIPYISADPRLAEEWAATLGPRKDEELRVGLVWGGNPKHPNDRNRSAALANFQPLSRVRGVRFYSLQKGEPAKQLADSAFASIGLEIADLTASLVDFIDTAAFIANLDLVITVDTSIAHLAGAMGKEVWVLLPLVPDWRWLLGRNDTPWYPTMRLWRQGTRGDWKGVLETVATELGARASGLDRNEAGITVNLPPSDLLSLLVQSETGSGHDVVSSEAAALLHTAWASYLAGASPENRLRLQSLADAMLAEAKSRAQALSTIAHLAEQGDVGEPLRSVVRQMVSAEYAFAELRSRAKSELL